ncbi:MAG: diacylglycerol kinase family protein, partial [bacterium]|nr:diacylglycerol kinase family protein [bacterium]
MEEIKVQPPFALVINTRSRRGKRFSRIVPELLRRRGVLLDGIYATGDHASLSDTVRSLVEGGRRSLIIGGGDGTISSIVDFCACR